MNCLTYDKAVCLSMRSNRQLKSGTVYSAISVDLLSRFKSQVKIFSTYTPMCVYK